MLTIMNEGYKSIEREQVAERNLPHGHYTFHHINVIECPNCKQTIEADYELCPYCGNRLHSNHCTFCGAPMDKDDLFCGECGGSVKGIKCPHCGTLSFRSFCPKCNHPVDKIGREEMQKAQNDPFYQRILTLAKHIIEAQESGLQQSDESETLPDEIECLLEKYRALQSTSVPTKKSESEGDASLAIKRTRTTIEPQAIKLEASNGIPTDMTSAIEELNALLKSMVPGPGLTPQMQRNYYSARKVAVYHKSKVREKVGWVCNLCGCQHSSPSECARPELGGNWVYIEKEITTKTYE